jgi:hypothetical protein
MRQTYEPSPKSHNGISKCSGYNPKFLGAAVWILNVPHGLCVELKAWLSALVLTGGNRTFKKVGPSRLSLGSTLKGILES